MNAERLRHLRNAVPFRPFTIRLVTGRRLDVPCPECVAMSPSGRTVNVSCGEKFVFLDMSHADVEIVES